ncbi:hypothetical protein GCM10010193_69320 [Kitasatospora atroaurantiaca]|uniref:Uncharacterized protein n=1 Tax=Kitasatospora atroaurantiaca TaxID=285545 RepID=A0A561EN22_9ACTN|nr:hypothetical protein [Kitasatospora atroaurantiaca]TWE17021.1 hypothetical protein FB465_2023 [Kitasatospora atroaurantiaca]
MTREERLRILGAATVAEIHRQVAAVPPPPPELIDVLRPVLAPAMERAMATSREATPLAA